MAGPIISPDSELGKELAKWNVPYVFRPFPRMIYKAQKRANGKVVCLIEPPSPFAYEKPQEYERALSEMDTFNKSCQRIVQDDRELQQAREEGWRHSPPEALEYFESLEQARGQAAAEAKYAAQRMSGLAQAELQAAEESTSEHVTDVRGKRK